MKNTVKLFGLIAAAAVIAVLTACPTDGGGGSGGDKYNGCQFVISSSQFATYFSGQGGAPTAGNPKILTFASKSAAQSAVTTAYNNKTDGEGGEGISYSELLSGLNETLAEFSLTSYKSDILDELNSKGYVVAAAYITGGTYNGYIGIIAALKQ